MRNIGLVKEKKKDNLMSFASTLTNEETKKMKKALLDIKGLESRRIINAP